MYISSKSKEYGFCQIHGEAMVSQIYETNGCA